MPTKLNYFSTKISLFGKISTISPMFCTVAHKGDFKNNIRLPKICHKRHELLILNIFKILTMAMATVIITTKTKITKIDASK